MRAYKTDIHKSYRKLHNSHKTKIISFDIENIVLISYIINAVESIFHIRKTSPFASFYFLNPILQSDFRLGMIFRILL